MKTTGILLLGTAVLALTTSVTVVESATTGAIGENVFAAARTAAADRTSLIRHGRRNGKKKNRGNRNNNNGNGGGQNGGGGNDGGGNGGGRNGGGRNGGGGNGGGRNGGGQNGGGGNGGGGNGKKKGNNKNSRSSKNFCEDSGFKISDGTQVRDQNTCSKTIQGAIPDVDHMVSTIILSPENGAKISVGEKVQFRVRVDNMQLGEFLDPQKAYYSEPQKLNRQGNIIGHQHIVAQIIQNKNQPLDAREFEFFKGLDGAPEGDNELFTDLEEGFTKRGQYRICSITGASAHQPVVMPVAQRGSQDDCIRITVE